MKAYELPTSVEVAGKEYRIRSDYRAIIDILIAYGDPDLDDQDKAFVTLCIFYPDWKDIPQKDFDDALKKAREFIDCGYKDDGKPRPRMMDWEQDAGLIIPAVNKVSGTEVRQLQYMHWWTFFSYYLEIGESLYSNVLEIRSKKAKHKKLEKYEREFYQENKDIVDLKPKESTEVREEKQSILDWLDGKRG